MSGGLPVDGEKPREMDDKFNFATLLLLLGCTVFTRAMVSTATYFTIVISILSLSSLHITNSDIKLIHSIQEISEYNPSKK